MSGLIDFRRQSSVFTPEDQQRNMVVVGLGATGSNLAETAVRMGWKKLTLIDNDSVESHNLPNQVYLPKMVGTTKVNALIQILAQFADIGPTAIMGKTERVSSLSAHSNSYIIFCVDNMASRKALWDTVKSTQLKNRIFDIRMAAEHGFIYIVDPSNKDDVAYYESTLFSDEEVVPPACGYQSVITTARTLSCIAVHNAMAWEVSGNKTHRLIRVMMNPSQIIGSNPTVTEDKPVAKTPKKAKSK